MQLNFPKIAVTASIFRKFNCNDFYFKNLTATMFLFFKLKEGDDDRTIDDDKALQLNNYRIFLKLNGSLINLIAEL